MSDYSALAQRVSMSATGVRGCLMLSRDGTVLGAHPEGATESHLRSSWVRFAAVGDPERSYVEFPDQIWAFVRRGAYAAFAVADAGVRPGILVDLLEQSLMAGEQDRARERDTLRLPEVPAAPSGKPRTSMHKPDRATTPDPAPAAVGPPAPTAAEVAAAEEVAAASPASDPHPGVGDAAGEAGTDGRPDREDEGTAVDRGRDDESEVDRILLAKEFAGLLQVPKEDDEASR